MQNKEMSQYDLGILREIKAWKNPSDNALNKILKIINVPFEKGYDVANKVPGVEFAIQKSVGGIVILLNNAAQWSVRTSAIYRQFTKSGFEVTKGSDIHRLNLKDVDKVVGNLSTKYTTIAGTEGAATGAAGLPGIPADVVALLALNLRAIGEYATYYGYDMNVQHERLFALNVLGLASSPTDASKQIALTQLAKISKDVAQKKTWKQIQENLFAKIIKNISEKLGQRMTKAKMAQVAPIAGLAVGAGFNAYYTNKVCEAAYYLYRERFLAERYGSDIIDIKVNEE